MQLSNCSDGTYCPRSEEDTNTTCCAEDQGQFAVLGHARIPESVLSSIRATESSTSSSTASSTASSTSHTDSLTSSIALATASQTIASKSTSTPASTAPSASSTGLGQTAKIGIGVGISVGALLVAILFYVSFRYRKSQAKSPTLGRAEVAAPEPKNLNVNPELRQTHELAGARNLQELHTSYNRHEV